MFLDRNVTMLRCFYRTPDDEQLFARNMSKIIYLK